MSWESATCVKMKYDGYAAINRRCNSRSRAVSTGIAVSGHVSSVANPFAPKKFHVWSNAFTISDYQLNGPSLLTMRHRRIASVRVWGA